MTWSVVCRRCQASRFRGCGMVLNSTGCGRFTTAYEVIPADHEHFELLAWPCMITRWHHWRHKHLYVLFFCCLFDRLPVRISIPDLHHRSLWKKSSRSELMILKCSFPFSLHWWYWSARMHCLMTPRALRVIWWPRRCWLQTRPQCCRKTRLIASDLKQKDTKEWFPFALSGELFELEMPFV